MNRLSSNHVLVGVHWVVPLTCRAAAGPKFTLSVVRMFPEQPAGGILED